MLLILVLFQVVSIQDLRVLNPSREIFANLADETRIQPERTNQVSRQSHVKDGQNCVGRTDEKLNSTDR
jgi:hypothetical protein